MPHARTNGLATTRSAELREQSREESMRANSRDPLADFWHPVALSADLGEKPIPVTLLGTQLVIWRTANGIFAFKDLCIHRGTRLSLGWVDQGQLVCPYHGWCYNESGAVTKIPAIPADRPIPAKARAEKYHCSERYGLVFVCVGEPRIPIYEVPEFEREGFRTHIVGPFRWTTSAARSMENFMDEAHLPWAHPGTLGNRDNVPVIPNREVAEREGAFYFECNSEVRSRLDKNKMTTNRLTYDVVLPFTLYHENIYPEGDRVIDLFFVSPLSERESVRYMIVARNFALEQPPDKLIKFTEGIWEEDRVLIESQRPEEIPVDWNAELHLRGPDGPSMVYRRKLLEMGITKVV
jgi:phenylpropionate dioxygenase-like ring-hydroxylating dioxygenase large terminal subunit